MKREEFDQALAQTGIDYSTLSESELSKIMEEVEGEIAFSLRPFGLMNTIYSSEAEQRGVTLELYLVERILIKALNQKKLNEDMSALEAEYSSFIKNDLEEARAQRGRKKLVDSMKENLSLSTYCKPNKTAINRLFTWTTSKTFGKRKASVVEEIIDIYNSSKRNERLMYAEHYSSGAVSERGSLRGATALDVESVMGITMLYTANNTVFRLDQDIEQITNKLNEFVFDEDLHKTLLEYETKFNKININVVDF